MKVSEALARLQLQPADLRKGMLAQPVQPSLYKRLVDTPALLRERLNRPVVSKSLLDFKVVLRHLETSGFSLQSLNLAQIKCLCVNAESVSLPQFIRAIATDERLPSKTTWLMGLVGGYCTNWSRIDQRSQFEALLQRSFGSYIGANEGLWRIKRVAAKIFSPLAARFIAGSAVESATSVEEILRQHNLPITGDLANHACADLVAVWMAHFKKCSDETEARTLLGYLLTVIFGIVPASPEFYQAIELAIQSRFTKDDGPFRADLKRYVLDSKNLGDPRLPANQANWSPIPAASRQVLSWLAREALLFFFEFILPDSSENRQRKEFWIRYLPVIRDFQVALSDKDIRRLHARIRDIPSYSRIDHMTASAFLMKFSGTPDIVVVEFSETGHAAYIHNANIFESEVTGLHQYRLKLRDELKHRQYIHRILHHVGNWQRDAVRMLATWGVRP